MRRKPCEPWRWLVDVHCHGLGAAGRIERRPTDEELAQDTAKRVEVGARIDLATGLALLGSHVHGRTEDRAAPGLELLSEPIGAELGDTEVEDLHAQSTCDARVF